MTFFHGTPASEPGEFISPGFPAHESTGDPDGLVWFADSMFLADEWNFLRYPEVECHIFEVEPTGPYEPDRSLATRQVGPGNFQSRHPLRVIKEVHF